MNNGPATELSTHLLRPGPVLLPLRINCGQQFRRLHGKPEKTVLPGLNIECIQSLLQFGRNLNPYPVQTEDGNKRGKTALLRL